MFSGEKLKKIRQEKGYSQADLAKLLQLSRASYFNWENGKTKPNQKNLKQLSQIFKVDPTYFLSEHDIVNIFLKLNPDNQVKLENYAEELLKEQEIIKPLPKLYAYKVFEKLSAGTGYSYFGDGNYDTVFYDEQLD
ncbi:MAG: XRE family transcriptional regulator, partial [Streptococcus lutetiensis]